MKIKCVVVDDEPLAREGIADYVSKTAFLKLDGGFKNVFEAREYIEQHPVDLIFLDINMPGESGLGFLKSLKDPPLVIFTTAYREFAADSYELDAVDYLVKPIAFERFMKAVNKVYIRLEHGETHSSGENCFFVKVDGIIVKVMIGDILFVEGMKDYIKIHLSDRTKIVTLIGLKQVAALLPPSQFVRVHRSFIVSKAKVDKIEGNTIHIGDTHIPLAANLRAEVLELILGNRLWKRG